MAREKAPLPNAAPADDKKRAIDTAMAQIERMYGKGAIMRFGDTIPSLTCSTSRARALRWWCCPTMTVGWPLRPSCPTPPT